MTDPKRVVRPRRRAGTDGLPADLRAWFAGEYTEGTPWAALVYPDHVLIYERWQVWLKDHPNAQPPMGYAWIAKPPERLHGQPFEEALQQARRCAARGRSK